MNSKLLITLSNLIKEMINEPDPNKAVPDHRKEIDAYIISCDNTIKNLHDEVIQQDFQIKRLQGILSTKESEILNLKETVCKLAAKL